MSVTRKNARNVFKFIRQNVPVIGCLVDETVLSSGATWLGPANVIFTPSVMVVNVFKTVKIKIPANQAV